MVKRLRERSSSTRSVRENASIGIVISALSLRSSFIEVDPVMDDCSFTRVLSGARDMTEQPAPTSARERMMGRRGFMYVP